MTGEEMRDALAQAGAGEWFVFDKDGRGKQLSIRQSRNWPEGTERVWCWVLWEESSSGGVSSWAEVDSGSEPDVGSMVAKVLEFLSKEES